MEPSQRALATLDASHHGHAKWAALIDDRLVPMARRILKARDILHQAGSQPDSVLVRDFNSPVDVGLDSEGLIDLAQGNVFRTSSPCELGDAPCQALPKLAFVVDDRWEVTTQPKQTGRTLRGLVGVQDDVSILRDFESPHDEVVGDDEEVEFSDGPVFITRGAQGRTTTIIVEGTPYEWSKRSITYAEAVTLFDPSYPQHPDMTYSVTYDRGPRQNPDGILPPGGSVKVKEGMVFHVSPTGQS